MKNSYTGMTVNERLYAAGLMDEFDTAVQRKDSPEVRRILETVQLSEASIEPILEKLELEQRNESRPNLKP